MNSLMTVGRLIELLERCDPDAAVTIAHQPDWPFELKLDGIVVRGVMAPEHEIDEDDPDLEEGSEYGEHDLHYGPGIPKRSNDVILVAGDQLSYGPRDAWDHAEQ